MLFPANSPHVFSAMNTRQSTNMTYNQQMNNQFNSRRSLHASRTKMIFNGPIHGYIDRVTGEGPVIAYSEVTYVQPEPSSFRKTTVVEEERIHATTNTSRLPIENVSNDDEEESTPNDSKILISPSIPLPVEREVLETELRQVSPMMRQYVQKLLRQYEKSYFEKRGGQNGEDDQR